MPEIAANEAVDILLSREWSERCVNARKIVSLRQIITGLLKKDALPEDFDQVVFDHVVIEEADLTDLVIPFKMHFQRVFFLDGLHLINSTFNMLTVSGYNRGVLSLNEIKGQPSVSLQNLHVDEIRIYGGEGLDNFSISTSTIGRLTISDTGIKRQIDLHDSVDILDGLWLSNLSVVQGISLWRCTIHESFFRIHDVHCSGDLNLEVCKLNAPLSSLNSSCTKLSLNESECSGRLDFRHLSFQEIDLANTIITGQLLLNIDQLKREEGQHVWPFKSSRRMDTPPRLATRRGNTLGETVSIAEQLIVLRENFLRIPTAEKEEQYCAYHLVDATWGLSRYTLFNIITKWIAKRCSGYLLLPCRILGTMAAIIIFFSYLYIVFALNVPGRLVFSNGEPIFQNGVLYGIGRSLYFSIVTFSTLGYGDIHPVGLLKGFAAVEAFLGLVVMGVFVVSLARKLFRW